MQKECENPSSVQNSWSSTLVYISVKFTSLTGALQNFNPCCFSVILLEIASLHDLIKVKNSEQI